MAGEPRKNRELVVRMPPDLWQQVKDRSDAEERTVAQTIRLALKRYLRTPTQGPDVMRKLNEELT